MNEACKLAEQISLRNLSAHELDVLEQHTQNCPQCAAALTDTTENSCGDIEHQLRIENAAQTIPSGAMDRLTEITRTPALRPASSRGQKNSGRRNLALVCVVAATLLLALGLAYRGMTPGTDDKLSNNLASSPSADAPPQGPSPAGDQTEESTTDVHHAASLVAGQGFALVQESADDGEIPFFWVLPTTPKTPPADAPL